MMRVLVVVLALTALPSWAGAQGKAPDQDKGPNQEQVSTEDKAATPMAVWAAQTSADEIRLGWGAAVTVPSPAAKTPGAAAAPPSAHRIYKRDSRDGRYRLRMTLSATATVAVMRIEPADIGAMVQYGIEVVPASKTSAPTILPFNIVTPGQGNAKAQPASPASVTAAQSGAAEITVKWDAVPGATAYRIGRAVQPSGFQTLCELCPAVNAIVDRSAGGATGTKHTYTVAAFTIDGLGRPTRSNTVTWAPKGVLETAGGPPPKAVTVTPTALWAAQTAAQQVTLVWRAPAVAPSKGAAAVAEYRIYQERHDGRRDLVSTLGGTATRAVVRMRDDGAQQFLIAAVADSSVKDTSAEAIRFNLVTPASAGASKPPPAPGPVTAAQTGAGQITVTWSPVPGATGYLIARSKSPSGFQTLCELCPTTPSYTDDNAGGGAVYVYRVSANSAAGLGNRATSNELDLRGAATGPKDALTLTAPASPATVATPPSTVTLTWGEAQGAAGYRIRRSLNARDWQLITTVGPSARRYIDKTPDLVAQNPRYIIESFTATSSRQVTVGLGPKAAVP
jgi:hypothetical protein